MNHLGNANSNDNKIHSVQLPKFKIDNIKC